MFLYPSKPRQIFDPESVINTLVNLGDIGNWIVQVKKNGCRAIPVADKSGIKIWGRDKSFLTVSNEYDWNVLRDIFSVPFTLDGELIGRKQGETSNRLYLWDCPIIDGVNLIGRPYAERYQILHDDFVKVVSNSNLPLTADTEWTWTKIGSIQVGVASCFEATDWKRLLEKLIGKYKGSTGELEGLVFKNQNYNMNWSPSATREIKEQLKYLIKYRRIN